MTHVVIAGAGVAGLGAGLALSAVGVRVTILERRTVLDEVGAGLQLSPNATWFLRSLGVLDALLPLAVRPERVRIRRGRDAAEIVAMPLGIMAERRYGAPFLVVHRADLQRTLLDAIREQSLVTLKLGIAVETTADGGRTVRAVAGTDRFDMEADAFIDAGGLHARGSGEPDARPRFAGRLAWRALIPVERVAASFARPESNLWLGARAHLVHYPICAGALVNVVAITGHGSPGRDTDDVWTREGAPDDLLSHLAAWHTEPRALVEAAAGWRTWPLFEGIPGRPWSQEARSAVGDAAHPMVPFLAQGASQAIEDAAALADAVRSHAPDMVAALSAYEASRRPRAERVQRASRLQGHVYHLAGPAARARDLAMGLLGPRRMLDRMDWLYRNGGSVLSPDTIQ